MSISRGAGRGTRIDQLCTEINSLIVYYHRLPPCTAQKIALSMINERFEELNELSKSSSKNTSSSKSWTIFLSTTGCVMGLIFETYSLFVIGAAIAAIGLFSMKDDSSGQNTLQTLEASLPKNDATTTHLTQENSGRTYFIPIISTLSQEANVSKEDGK